MGLDFLDKMLKSTFNAVEGLAKKEFLISNRLNNLHTVCPGSSGPLYIVSYYIKWVTTSWTYSTKYCESKK